MSDFIPKAPFPLYPPALIAQVWEDTPSWVVDLQGTVPKEPVATYVWRLCAASIHSFTGDAAPSAEAFPPLRRGETGDGETIRVRAAWIADEVPLRAVQRLLAEVQRRSILAEETVGN